MDLRTSLNIPPSADKITYNDPVMFIGSCFSSSMGSKFEAGRMPVMINPSGTVYNPVSVLNTLRIITEGRKFTKDDLYFNNGTWISFNHYTEFSSEDSNALIERINTKSEEARHFLSTARFLFITFGTARVYRFIKTGEIVSNCHKIKASEFTRELLGVDDVVSLWKAELDKLEKGYPGLKIIFTISPVRHWKDGAHGNQVSKSVLFLAVEELLGHPSCPGYFPSYELLMDDLRDYRFYESDMLHPSDTAIDYIWETFTGCFFDNSTRDTWNEVNSIYKAVSHRIRREGSAETQRFAGKMLEKINLVTSKVPALDLGPEKKYFLDLLQKEPL